jgi:hypothetical protein
MSKSTCQDVVRKYLSSREKIGVLLVLTMKRPLMGRPLALRVGGGYKLEVLSWYN